MFIFNSHFTLYFIQNSIYQTVISSTIFFACWRVWCENPCQQTEQACYRPALSLEQEFSWIYRGCLQTGGYWTNWHSKNTHPPLRASLSWRIGPTCTGRLISLQCSAKRHRRGLFYQQLSDPLFLTLRNWFYTLYLMFVIPCACTARCCCYTEFPLVNTKIIHL